MTAEDPMENLARIFKALSDKTRLRIVKLLEHGELCVCDIGAALGMIQPKVSFHLSALKNSGLLKDRKVGKWVHYSLDESEIFKRFLVFSVLERIPQETIGRDKERLAAFLKMKDEQANIGSINERKTCCAGR
jgi:ArsR family transcriptional regulator, arsenate/arsenite/antimonite-responsive transcriptional repressor